MGNTIIHVEILNHPKTELYAFLILSLDNKQEEEYDFEDRKPKKSFEGFKF